MRANRKFVNDDAGQVGIGTMIVFIATILVAAVAAGVLIDTSGKLQERSARTGNEATEKVSGNLEVVKILGRRDATTNATVHDVNLTLTVAPGAPPMDLKQLKILWRTTDNTVTFGHNDNDPQATLFNVTENRDADGTFNAKTGAAATDTWVVNAGDLVTVNIDLMAGSTNLPLSPRDKVQITLVPEVGNTIVVGFTAPASFGADTRIQLV